MKACVFLGPTLPLDCVPERIDVFGPAALGSVYRAVREGYSRIGIIDGVFGVVPSVWHKEILYAIETGATVYGASSLGALRAAELYFYGMEGVGRIYRLFRSGILSDDDEVAVIHGPMNAAYGPLSEPMVNIRFTLNRMRRSGLLSRDGAAKACDQLKSLFYPERTLDRLTACLREHGLTGDPEAAVWQCYVDVKAGDARQLLARMSDARAPSAADRIWEFLPTRYWSMQFDRAIGDVPRLEPRRTGGVPTSKPAMSPAAGERGPEA
ncbi:MAG: TfuA-like protein [Alphaproteobacteria bacterium]